MKTCSAIPDKMNQFPVLYFNSKLFVLLTEFTYHVYTADEENASHCILLYFSSISDLLGQGSTPSFCKKVVLAHSHVFIVLGIL